MKLKILAVVMLVMALVATGYGCLDSEAANPDEKTVADDKSTAGVSDTTSSARIAIAPDSYEFGNISFDLASHDFVVMNTGDDVLEISKVSTNCGCTTAEIDKYELSPGEETILNVTFDPQHHMSTGHFLREAFIESNDPENPKAKVEIQMTVVGEPPEDATGMHQPQR